MTPFFRALFFKKLLFLRLLQASRLMMYFNFNRHGEVGKSRRYWTKVDVI